jgi:hypothetical protein
MNVDGSGSLDAKEWSKLFEIFTNFIVGGKTFKANQHGKTIYRALLQLIPNIKSKLISDELLNKFVSGVLDVLKQTEVFQEAELPLVYGLWKIVKPFVHRLKNVSVGISGCKTDQSQRKCKRSRRLCLTWSKLANSCLREFWSAT